MNIIEREKDSIKIRRAGKVIFSLAFMALLSVGLSFSHSEAAERKSDTAVKSTSAERKHDAVVKKSSAEKEKKLSANELKKAKKGKEASPSEKIERAVKWAIEIADDPTHGYSQGNANATADCPYTGSREGPDYDCSSLIYHALDYAGFDIIAAWKKNPAYHEWYKGTQSTGDADTVWEDLQVIGGFTKYSWDEIKNNLRRGDILCVPEHHIAFYIGDGLTVEARGIHNPRGGHWRTGDQGGEIDFYDAFDNRGWTEVYRYTGK